MDFKRKQIDIRNLLVLSEKKMSKSTAKKITYKYQYQKGVYVFSKELNSDNHKIGMAFGSQGLFNRLKSYKICYPFPREFYLQYLFITDKTSARALETQILDRTDKLKHIQKAEDLGDEKDQGEHSLEWRFTASKEVLNSTLIEELNKSPELWKYAVIFGANSWKIIPSPTRLTNFQRPASTRTEKPLFGEEKKADTFIPGPFEPVVGKFAWVVNKGKKKDEFKALRGKIDRFDGSEIWLKFPNYKDAFAYKRDYVFKTKTEAEADIVSYT